MVVLLGQFHCFKVNHIFREVNKCADNLARADCSLAGNFVVVFFFFFLVLFF